MKKILMFVLIVLSPCVYSQSTNIPTETLTTDFEAGRADSQYKSDSSATLNISQWGEGKLLINLNISIRGYLKTNSNMWKDMGTTLKSMNLLAFDNGMGSFDVLDDQQTILGKLNIFNNVVVLFFYEDIQLSRSFRLKANTTLSFKKGRRICYSRRNKEIECPRIVER